MKMPSGDAQLNVFRIEFGFEPGDNTIEHYVCAGDESHARRVFAQQLAREARIQHIELITDPDEEM